MNILGIDPGSNGAFVFIPEIGDIQYMIMPLDKEGDINGQYIYDWIKSKLREPLTIYLEDVHSIFGIGATQNFKLGINIGIVRGVITALGLKYKLVAPKKWQSYCHQGEYSKEIKAKQRTLDAATRLYPDLTKVFTPVKTKRMRNEPVPHDGLIDALMIAYYGKIKLLEQK
jgi:hypothetical protein